MKIKELIKILQQYEQELEVTFLVSDSLDREKSKTLTSISERYELEGGSSLETELGSLSFHISDN